MRVYRVSPVLQYSPFYKLTYFSKFNFDVGNICEIDFNKRKIMAVVVEVLETNDAKVEIRKGNFITKKIENKLEKEVENRFNFKQFSLIQNFAHKFLVAIGEVVFALDSLHKQKKFKTLFDKDGKIFDQVVIEDFDIENFIQYQSPHISLIDLLILFIKIFDVKVDLVFRSDFIGVSEKLFLDSLDIPFKLVTNDNKVRKYTYNRSNLKFEIEDLNSRERILDDEIKKIINDANNNNEKIFIFVLAHGYQSAIFCKDCKSGYSCDNCQSNYSILNENESSLDEEGTEMNLYKRYLFCKNCENKKILKPDQYLICKKCGSWGLFPYGEGLQKVYEELGSDSRIIFIDESKKKLTDRKLKEQVEVFLTNKNKNIILGTKRVLQSLKKEKIKLNTIIVSLGAISSGKNFDSDEKFIKLLSQLESVSNKIYIGKQDKENNIFDRYKNKEKFVEEELQLREQFGLPPYKKVVSFCFDFRLKKVVDKYIKDTRQVSEIKKNNKLTYYFILSELEIENNRHFLESLRQFGELVVSNAVYQNFIKKTG